MPSQAIETPIYTKSISGSGTFYQAELQV